MSQLDTLLQARLAGRRQHGSFWSSSGRGILVIAALNIVLLWSVTGGVVNSQQTRSFLETGPSYADTGWAVVSPASGERAET